MLWASDLSNYDSFKSSETLKPPRRCPIGQDHVDSNTTLLVQRRQIDVHACYKNASWTSQCHNKIASQKWSDEPHSNYTFIHTWSQVDEGYQQLFFELQLDTDKNIYLWIEFIFTISSQNHSDIPIALVPILWTLASTNIAHLKLFLLASPRKAKCFSAVAIVSQPKYLEDEIQPVRKWKGFLPNFEVQQKYTLTESCWKIPCITNHQSFEERKWEKNIFPQSK